MVADIRDASKDDLPAILELNLESEAFPSALSPERLVDLHRHAWYHRVACRYGKVEAFLLPLRQESDCDSRNYRCFAERRVDLVCIDRTVVNAGRKTVSHR